MSTRTLYFRRVIWPFSIAPYHVHMVALNYDQPEVQAVADEVYAGLQKAGVEVVFDDRNKKAGFAFADADLMGIPLRIILSPKRIPNGEVEFKYRDGSESGNPSKSRAAGLARRTVPSTPSVRYAAAASSRASACSWSAAWSRASTGSRSARSNSSSSW